MKTKLTIIGLSLVSTMIFATTQTLSLQELRNLNLPTPGQGIQVLPIDQMNLSDSQKKEFLNNIKSQGEKGYVNKNTLAPRLLMQIASPSSQQSNMQSSPQETGLKSNLSDIKLTFNFRELTGAPSEHIIGFAPAGMYKSNAWTGIAEIFKTADFNRCSYTVFDIATSQGGAQISQEAITGNINGKICSTEIEGNKASGFSYSIRWYDNHFIKSLECADPVYQANKKQALIELAKKVDLATA